MAKFCTKCGTPMNDDDMFCGVCGAKYAAPPAREPVTVSAAQPVYQPPQEAYHLPAYDSSPTQNGGYNYPPPEYIPGKKSKKGLFIGLGIGGAVIIAAVVVLIILLTGGLKQGTPEQVFDTAKKVIADSYNSGKPVDKKYYDLIFQYHYVKPEYKSMAEYSIGYEMTALTGPDAKANYGDNLTVDYVIENYETLPSSDYTDSNFFNSEYMNAEVSKIQEIRRYELKLMISGTKDSNTRSQTLYMIKYDGKWYISIY